MSVLPLLLVQSILIFVGSMILARDIKLAARYYNEKNYKDFGISMAWIIITTIILIKIII